ncbi:MAG TPA: peptide MFS transporter, partial [Bacteroidia bacterium]|nr:peptide MFS transporter [Bacteroidia bacterium]
MNQELSLEDIQNFKGKYPKQIWWLFLSEMWERFSFYGMRGMLAIFMVEQLHLSEKESNLKYGATQAFVYALAFVGGLFADKILGFRRSIFLGGILMATGSFILAYNPQNLFYIGISFTIVGCGFFKPNISTMVGMLYKKGDPRQDTGFSLFYSGMNIGGLFGGLLCIKVADDYSWNLAFSLAGIFMILGLTIFIFTQRILGPIGKTPLMKGGLPIKKNIIYAVYGLSVLMIPIVTVLVQNEQYTDLFMYTIGPATLLYLAYEMRKLNLNENKKLIAAIIFIFFSIFFWAFFEQSGGSLSLFARYNLDGTLAGLDPNQINNSANSFFVVILSPFVGLIWLWLNRKRMEPNSVIKFGLAFLFLGASFYVFYSTRFFANSLGIASLNTFTFAYLIITLGELCLSPIGLSLMTKLAPKP